MSKKQSLQFYMSSIHHSSRIEKECASLVESGLYDRVVIFGMWEEGLKEHEFLNPKLEVVRAKLPFYKKKVGGILKILFGLYARLDFCWQFMKYSKEMKPDSIGVHNPLLLSYAYKAAKRIGARFIYVPHELERQRAGIHPMLTKLTDYLEKKYMPKVEGMTVVCEPIREWYEKEYGVKGIGVVPNVPFHPHPGKMAEKRTLFRDEFNIPEDHLIFTYNGIVDTFRGTQDLLTVFKQMPADRHLVLMGYGLMEDEIKQAEKEYPNIHFKPAVAHKDILPYTSSADVGLWFCQDMPLSMTYALPNKFFQYTIAGLYIAVSENFVEQKRIIGEEKLGTTVPVDIEKLKDFVLNLSKEEIDQCLKDSKEFRENIGWKQKCEPELLKVYSGELKLEKA